MHYQSNLLEHNWMVSPLGGGGGIFNILCLIVIRTDILIWFKVSIQSIISLISITRFSILILVVFGNSGKRGAANTTSNLEIQQ